MRELVAVVGPPGPAWVDELRRCWDAGDAVLPVDHRLPGPAVANLLDTIRPTRVATVGGPTERRAGRLVDAGDALVLATSGTTGRPKGVVLTHAAVAASAAAVSGALAVDARLDAWLCCLPLAHAGGMGVVTRAVHTGTPLTVLPGFDASAVDEFARTCGRRVLVSLVATALARVDADAFRVVLLGGDAPPRWPAGRPASVVVTYGMTETGGGCVYDGIPLPDVEVRVVDAEVQVRGPILARAYRAAEHDAPVTNAAGWLETGDAGRWAPDGTLIVDGRMGDVIVTGGEKVWPAPLEAVLAAVPGVARVAVVGRDDPEWGQRVVAVVVPSDPADPPTLEALRDAAREVLAPWALPKSLELVGDLPSTALGKIQRRLV